MKCGVRFCKNRVTEAFVSARHSRGAKEAATKVVTIRKDKLILCAALMFVLQVTISHRLSYRALRFDLLYLLVAFLALEATPSGALWSALGLGLLRDLGSSGRLGSSAVLMVLGAAGLLDLRGRLFRETALANMLLVFVFVLFCGVVDAGVVAIAERYAQWGTLLGRAMGQALLTAAICPVLFLLYECIGLVERQQSVLA